MIRRLGFSIARHLIAPMSGQLGSPMRSQLAAPMARHLAWTLTAVLVLGACGAGDRQAEGDAPATTPPAQPTPSPSSATDRPATTGAESAEPGSTPPVATAGAAATEKPASTTVQPTERLYTVQIAAYLSADSARAMAAKLTQRGFPVWTMEVRVGDRTYHRIRVGAHPRLGEMRRLGQQISTQFRQEVWVAPVDMAAQIPAGAVEATRALLQR